MTLISLVLIERFLIECRLSQIDFLITFDTQLKLLYDDSFILWQKKNRVRARYY